MDCLELIKNSGILKEQDFSYINSISEELKDTFCNVQMFITPTEMRISVLNDIKFPSADSKYWQSIREQNTMYSELINLSYEYRKLLININKLNRKLSFETDDIEQELIKIDIEQSNWLLLNMQKTAKARIDEIKEWSFIKKELEKDMIYSKTDVNEHQLLSYAARFINQSKVMTDNISRKKKGSNHYKKQKMVVALLHEKIRNQRQDYLHKISKYLVDNYDTICIEDLAVSNMVKNHCLARAISDMGWGEFRKFLGYKCDWYGKNLIMIGRFEPSSKICSCCGHINKELTLNDREWTCKHCNTVHDRDVNAGKNIKNFGLRNQPSVTQSDGLPCACNVETTMSLML